MKAWTTNQGLLRQVEIIREHKDFPKHWIVKDLNATFKSTLEEFTVTENFIHFNIQDALDACAQERDYWQDAMGRIARSNAE